MIDRIRWTPLACVMCLALPFQAIGQSEAEATSDRATVSQQVNGTTITVDFGRPVVEGRIELFGGVVPWGELWSPGGGAPTILSVDGPIELDGHEIPAGEYSVWMRPTPEEWMVHLYADPRPAAGDPAPEDHVLSFRTRPEQGGHMEALNWYFPVIGSESVELRIHWGTTFIPLTVRTPPF